MKTSKRIVSLLLALTMLLGVFCVSAAAEEGTVSETLTVTYNSNYPAESGMADQIPGTDTATEGYKIRDCAEWGWEYPAGYTLKGWSNGSTIYSVGDVIALDGSLSFNAVWEKVVTDDPTDDPSDDPTDDPTVDPTAPTLAKGTRISKAILLNCRANYKHDEYISWTADKDYVATKWSNKYDTWYLTISVKGLSAYVPYYGYDYDCYYGCKHDCDYDHYCEYNYYDHVCGAYCDEDCEKYTALINSLYCYIDGYNRPYYSNNHKVIGKDSYLTLLWNERSNKWIVFEPAEVIMTCDSYSSTTSCNSRHNHTIKYTDGVSGKVIFRDVTYTVKHNAKTPTVKDPVREGYRFAGWSPKVETYADECVTYVAKWVPDNAPALTTEHVAYLKGYGKGYVRPEGKITRAEAATMLFRLLDAESLREYYTNYNSFTDVKAGDWYNDAVSTLTNAGIIKGYAGGKYNPNEAITRAELTAMLSRFVYGETTKTKANFNDVSTNYWAYDEIALAQELGWIKGYGGSTFNPDASISRAEVAAMLNRMLDRDDCKVKDTKNFIDNPVNAWYYRDIVEASIAH